jgi:hypothetical protein
LIADASTYGARSSGPKPVTVEAILAGAGEKPREYVPLWSPSSFTGFEPPEDFVLMGDCHLTRGNLTVLGGWPGVGKSRAALGLAIAGARGVPWLGHRIHARFRSLIIQCENGPYRLKSELTEALAGIDLDDWLRISPPPPYGLLFQEPAFREELRAKIADWQPGLVIIDPWNRAADGDKQADYRGALDAVFECLPDDPSAKPAVLVIHHMRKKSNEAIRKTGRDLLHELAGSYQIGSAARAVFALEPASKDVTDGTVVLTCCKNNDGKEGAPSAWHRRNGLFDPNPDFDMEAFLSGDEGKNSASAIATALRGMAGEPKGAAAARLVSAGVCGRSKAYQILKDDPRVEEDSSGRYWWNEEGD